MLLGNTIDYELSIMKKHLEKELSIERETQWVEIDPVELLRERSQWFENHTVVCARGPQIVKPQFEIPTSH